ncbi:hypothetical protein, partial [Streptomyces altiplanensis]
RNGRFLRTHPRGLSSGLSFGISCSRLYQTLSGPTSSAPSGSRFRVSLSGDSDSISAFPFL